MNLFAFLGIPGCAVHGCQNPGLLRIELEGERGKVWAHLCIGCLGEVGPCLGELSHVAHEEVPLLLEPEPEKLP